MAYIKYIYIILASVVLVGVVWFFYADKNNVLSEFIASDVQENVNTSEVETYTHHNPVFSFSYPAGFSVSSFPEGEGEVVLVQSKENSSVGMQVYVAEFDEGGPLTIQRIKEDLPDLEMKKVREVDLFSDTQVVVFLDSSDMVNVWFIREGYMYQITATQELGGLFEMMMGSLKFQE